MARFVADPPPLFVTTCVIVKLPPAVTCEGIETVVATSATALVVTAVETVTELLDGSESGVLLSAVAVLVTK